MEFHFEHRFEHRPGPLLFHSLLIFVLEGDQWKIIYRQTSVPGTNEETTGHSHSAIQALVEAAQQGFSLTQRDGLASVMFTDIAGSSPLAAPWGITHGLR